MMERRDHRITRTRGMTKYSIEFSFGTRGSFFDVGRSGQGLDRRGGVAAMTGCGFRQTSIDSFRGWTFATKISRRFLGYFSDVSVELDGNGCI
jgi:hypothetical protein